MNETERIEFVSQPQVAVIATVDTKGRAHAVPVWYLYRDGAFDVFTFRGMQKHKNVLANGRATLCIDARDGSFRQATVEGPCEVQDPVTEAERFELFKHYRGEEGARAAVADGRHEQSVILRLRPERWY